MDVEQVMQEYIDRCERVLEKKEQITEEHRSGAEADQTEFLDYARSVNAMQRELLTEYLSEVSYPNLKRLLAIFQSCSEEHTFPDDISSLKQSNVKKNKLINRMSNKDPEVVIDRFEDALEQAEENGIDLNV